MVKIYSLIDPINNNIRYIGKTITPLNERLKVHINQSKKAIKPTHKEAWIKSLILKGERPIIKLIEEVEIEKWVEREIYWIKHYPKLTNISIGGDGGNLGGKHTNENLKRLSINAKNIKGFYKSGLGRKWTEEQKEKRRLKPAWNKGLKGKKASNETKLKMSNSHKGHKR